MTDLNLLRILDAVAKGGNFRAAADRLGVTRSAVSQGIRRLEDSCGTALVSRTTRSVRLTEAGERFHLTTAEALAGIDRAFADLALDQTPRGTLRIAVTSIAERFLFGPMIASFLAAYPDVMLDVTVTDDESDIVAAGLDAGIRLGEVIQQDMIAIPLTGPQRQVAVAAPAYLAQYGTPRHPRDLTAHRCIGWRPSPDASPYRWEFEEAGRAFDVAVPPHLTTNDMQLMIRTALAGAGITFGMHETFRPYIDSGQLTPILQDFLPPFAGFYLFFPSRANMPAKLRAMVDHVKAMRRDG
ncbi:LysR family transcriptional regulator [Paracoccus shanxieyensis]|uniref:LysR family transcriptional regulator n=1 Tax=Paracoccus shanxieyensis TaxID=2675752 RepID=A0A6L6IZ38_9RHOB|nr:LysR family transcriptional regulator [Paracoccus shanxieyensis]MTH65493.1 LysR family transcriptional regulator [Paracoccus shanxieyensis]MTH88711.1 LysR family transcriptional regulator [Paracoccus shanxieyensis]